MTRDPEDNLEGVTTKIEITSPYDGQTQEGYITANFRGAELVEVFVAGFGKSGSTLEGWTQFAAILLSMGLQSGLPFADVLAKVDGMKFEPYGSTTDPDIPTCESVPDYMVRWIDKQIKKRKEIT